MLASSTNETGFSTLPEVASYARSLRAAAAAGTPLSGDVVVQSLARALADDRAADGAEAQGVDWDLIRDFVVARAHLPPKHWPTVKEGLGMLRDVVGEPGRFAVVVGGRGRGRVLDPRRAQRTPLVRARQRRLARGRP